MLQGDVPCRGSGVNCLFGGRDYASIYCGSMKPEKAIQT